MKKRKKGRFIIPFAVIIILLGVFVVGFWVVDYLEESSRIIPEKESLTPNLEDYIFNLDEEGKEKLMAAAMEEQYPVNWPVLWIVVKRVNVDGLDENKRNIHFDLEMSDEEADYLKNEMSERFRERISEYTNGLVNIEVDTIIYDEVTLLGFENSLDVESFADIKDDFSDYNTIICTSRLRSTDGQQGLFTDWCGLARVGLLDGNYGFAQAQTNVEPSYEEESMFCEFEDNPVPEEAYIHEFLHTFENFEDYMLDCDGNPDEAEDNGYECLTSFGANGFYEYYRDLLNGNVLHKKRGKNVGMNEKLWRTEALLMDIAKGRVETDLR